MIFQILFVHLSVGKTIFDKKLKNLHNMEVKKSPKADLRSWRGVFLEGGLVLALVVCIVAFSISQKDKTIVIQDTGGVAEEIEMIDITQEEIEPPAEPQKQTIAVITDLLEVVKNDTQIEQDFTFFESDDDIDLDVLEIGTEKIEEETPFIVAEEMPSFQGGDLNTFRNWVMGNLVYPTLANEYGISGRVIVNFVVEKDGSLTNIRVLQSPDPLLSEAAIAQLQKSPRWTPGKNRNIPVRIQYTMPIEFKLNN